ncbi:TPA: shikimate kinase [Candidatus Sumerlaeota bacterium]|nr:shikimate kinase [Candidatus Sumerlaeota bacterium]
MDNPMHPSFSHILLTGFKGCGKSTVGRKLAARLNAEFVDLDTIIEDLFVTMPQSGGQHLSFREVFRALGGDAFRELELDAARHLATLARATDERLVIALGGGALMRPETREILIAVGTVFYLQVPLDEILRRAHQTGFPAFLENSPDPAKEFIELFHRREPIYLEHAHRIIDLGAALPDAAVDIIVSTLNPIC